MHPEFHPGQIVLAPGYLPHDPESRIRCRVRPGRRRVNLGPRWGAQYQLETLDPYPHRFIRRTAAELSPLTSSTP